MHCHLFDPEPLLHVTRNSPCGIRFNCIKIAASLALISSSGVNLSPLPLSNMSSLLVADL